MPCGVLSAFLQNKIIAKLFFFFFLHVLNILHCLHPQEIGSLGQNRNSVYVDGFIVL